MVRASQNHANTTLERRDSVEFARFCDRPQGALRQAIARDVEAGRLRAELNEVI
ncbi:hypothetical protein HDC37_000258 [Microbacterium sp. AK009]|nr:hypothetical protein [Microbacterium sp. AK009]